MKMYEELELLLYVFLTSALHGSMWSASRPGRFTPMERGPGTRIHIVHSLALKAEALLNNV